MNIQDLPDDILNIIKNKSIVHYNNELTYYSFSYTNLPLLNKYFNKKYKNKKNKIKNIPDDIYGIYMYS